MTCSSGSESKESACNAGDVGSFLDWEDPLEKLMATNSSISAWRIPWTEEPGGLQFLESQKARYDSNKQHTDEDTEAYKSKVIYSEPPSQKAG